MVRGLHNRRHSSPVWDTFTVTVENQRARCNHCRNQFSYRAGSTSNMTRHSKLKHPTIQTKRQPPITFEDEEMDIVEVQGDSCQAPPRLPVENQTDNAQDTPATFQAASEQNQTAASQNIQGSSQPRMYAFVRTPLFLTKKQKLDEQLTKMIVKGFHPFSVVDEPKFRKFCAMLNPNYSLPTPKTISSNFVPQYYKECRAKTQKELQDQTITITSDGWTSASNQSYLSITAQFITEEIELKSVLLGCIPINERNTADNIKSSIEVLTKWGLKLKVISATTDNGANTKAAIERGQWKWVPCTDHTLDLIVRAAIKDNITPTKKKVKNIVRHLKLSPIAEAKLLQLSEQMGLPKLKLKLCENKVELRVRHVPKNFENQGCSHCLCSATKYYHRITNR